MVFHLSLIEIKSPQVSRTLLSILADLSNAWMVSTRPLTSKSPSSGTNPFVTVPSVPITIGITVIFMFQSFFSSLARSRYKSLFSLLFSSLFGRFFLVFLLLFFLLTFFFSFFFFLTITRSARLAKIRWSFVPQNLREFWASHFLGRILDFAYTISWFWSNLNSLHNSQWITFPTQSCLVLYSLCANLLHSLIMWLIVSSHSPYNLHLFSCLVYFCFDIVIPYGAFFFVLKLQDIQFLSKGFPFLAMSKFSLVRCRLFVAWNIHTVVFLPIFVFWLLSLFTPLVFHISVSWSLSDSKSPQVSITRLRILSNAVIWIVSTRPPTSKSLLLLLFTPLEFFTSVLADGFSLEFEWQKFSSSLQDSSRDSEQCCHLDSLNPSANF